MAFRHLRIDPAFTLGLDVGIGSAGCGAILNETVSGLFVRCFPVPETPKEKELLSKQRRDHRLMRRQTRRRRQRRKDLARILAVGLDLDSAALASRHAVDPWLARKNGLDRALTPLEFAAALLHLAKRRGFKSNSKSEKSSNDAETGKVLQGVARMQEQSQRYRTIGEMFAVDPAFGTKKRNRPNDYAHTTHRDQTRAEILELFRVQRKLGRTWATQTLEERVLDVTLFQRPLQASEHLVGPCPFEAGEKRASMNAPSFERFRYLAKINTVSVVSGKGEPRRLRPDEIRAAAALFGVRKSISYKDIRAKIGLSDDEDFVGVPRRKPEKGTLYEGADVCARAGACAGTAALHAVLEPHLGALDWAKLLSDGEVLDRIAFTVSFREEIRKSGSDGESIEEGLRTRDVPETLIEPILSAVEQGVFKDFKKAGNLSAKAARAINPHMAQGMVYSDACARVGYDHARQAVLGPEDIANPVVRKSVREAWKLLSAVISRYGRRPGRITIEMGRDVGKSVEERGKIERGDKEREAEKEALRADYEALLNRPPNAEELLAFQLWKEQGHHCLYSGKSIHPTDLDLSKRRLEIDHALPRSRSQDNGYANKVLCFTEMNQAKRNRTPFEWLTGDSHPDARSWEEYAVDVESLNIKGIKKRNLLMRNFADREGQFIERNLNDTRYAARVLRAMCERMYGGPPKGEGERRVFTRPGALTATVRRVWGLETLKKDAEGKRHGDLHHAVDAICIAALGNDEALTQRLTAIHQYLEGRGLSRIIDEPIDPPWPDFRRQVEEKLKEVFVSRPEIRKTTGEAHEATIRRIRTVRRPVGQTEKEAVERKVFERKDIHAVTEKDLDRLDPVRNAALIAAVRDWLSLDKKARAARYPRMPCTGADREGPEIRKLRLPIVMKAGLEIRGGFAGNGRMVRVDVYKDDQGYWLVPVYTHQINNLRLWPKPPALGCVRDRPPESWHRVDPDTFVFTLYPGSYVRLTNRDGKIEEGYFRGMNVAVASLVLSQHHDLPQQVNLGAKTARTIEKFRVDILGGRTPIGRESLRWPGAGSI